VQKLTCTLRAPRWENDLDIGEGLRYLPALFEAPGVEWNPAGENETNYQRKSEHEFALGHQLLPIGTGVAHNRFEQLTE
jgi:hypothetical protein